MNVKAYQKKVEGAGEEIAKQLSEIGYSVAYSVMQGHVFSGETIESLTLDKKGEGRYVLYAESQAILFFEFGAGVRYGGGHPWDDDFGFGPGTYPGNGHWERRANAKKESKSTTTTSRLSCRPAGHNGQNVAAGR